MNEKLDSDNIDRWGLMLLSLPPYNRAAIQALSFPVIRSRIVWEYREILNLQRTCNSVTLYRVPGHIGVEEKEKVDELSRKGAATTLVGPEPFLGLEMHFSSKNLQKKLRNIL